MKIHRLKAMFFRLFKTSIIAPARLFEDIYWPVLDILAWGMATQWIGKSVGHQKNVVLVMLVGVVLWNGVIRSNYQICVTMVDEVWERNFVNLFCTPLMITEWMASVMILGIFRMTFTIMLGSSVVWLLYGISIFDVGWVIVPVACGLLMFAWCIGLLSASCVMYFGQRVMSLIWAISWFFLPFSAALYPVDCLPYGIRWFAYALPASHFFTCLRQTVLDGSISYIHLVRGLLLAVIGVVFISYFFIAIFKKSCAKGLSRLE